MNRHPSDQLKTRNFRKTFLILLAAWFSINIIQAFFMEIMSDEAYYGLYAANMDWGYYDHPPMVALLIRISSAIFSGNLGIRFMTILLQMGTLILVWKTLNISEPDSRNVYSFFIVAFSITMFSVYGVITSPDAPLLFFTALFLFAYKKFISIEKWPVTFLLAVSMAGLVYSKYQAVIVIGFLVLSNLSLLGKFRFWVAGILALVLLSPHIYWQISNNFPSLQYHLIDRSAGFKWKYFFEYLPNQMAVFNPVTLGAVIYVLIKFKPDGVFSRSLYFQIIGFIGFFWLTSFRGHVEPHWTIACSIPMIILLTETSVESSTLLRYIRKFILPTIILLFALRILVLTDFQFVKSSGFSGKKEKFEYIGSVAKDLPVIFIGSFQNPSLYPFFTGKEATVISSVYSRQTQFDIWQFERKYHNKPVFACIDAEGKSQVYGSGQLQFSGFRTDSLQTVSRIKIKFNLGQDTLHPGDSVRISFTLQNTYNYDIDFNHREFPVGIYICIIRGKEMYTQDVILSEPVDIIPAGKTIERDLTVIVPEISDGNYSFGICLNTLFGYSLNSHFTKISIKNVD